MADVIMKTPTSDEDLVDNEIEKLVEQVVDKNGVN